MYLHTHTCIYICIYVLVIYLCYYLCIYSSNLSYCYNKISDKSNLRKERVIPGHCLWGQPIMAGMSGSQSNRSFRWLIPLHHQSGSRQLLPFPFNSVQEPRPCDGISHNEDESPISLNQSGNP